MMKGLVALAVLLGGCDLYFGGGDDDVCAYPGGGAGVSPEYEVRDPNTGLCTSTGGGYCNDACGPCPAGAAETSAGALPDWGACYGHCYGLDEQSCFVASGCYAAYLDDPAADGKREFWGCWDTAYSGPVQGQCTNNDAYECSRHDDCIAIYNGGVNTSFGSTFQQCAPEPTTYCVADADCGSDAFCDTTVCYPSPTCTECATCGACPDSNTCYGICIPKDPRACDVIDCGPGYHCEEQCTDGPMGYCEPACVQDLTCASVDCAPGYTCTEVCTADSNGQLVCSPTCVPNPGDCYGTVACDALPPSCPSGTRPGITNGCWSGYCIPESACGQPPCETLATETACVARMDCLPVYDGDQCTCYPDHCECQVLTYARCETL